MNCKSCSYWTETLYGLGKCSMISEKIEIELVMGWDGAYVKSIETVNDFGCVLYNEK